MEWRKPQRIDLDDSQLPRSFDPAWLPYWIADYVREFTGSLEVPADLPGMLALSALSALAGGRVDAEYSTQWREQTNLYVAIAMNPGTRKSAVFKGITAPLRVVESELAESTRLPAAQSAVVVETAERRVQSAQAKLVKLSRSDPGYAAALQDVHDAVIELEQAKSNRVYQYRLFGDDATPEQLVTIMEQQHGRMALIADESGPLKHMQGMYSAAGHVNDTVFLKAHEGSSITVDRRTRSEHIDSPCLAVGITIQPKVLKDFAGNKDADGNGLLARFLFVMPKDKVGYLSAETADIDAAVVEAYNKQMIALARTLLPMHNRVAVKFSPEAKAVLNELQAQIQVQMRPGGQCEPIKEWASKLHGASIRIAVLLHLASGFGYMDPVREEEARNAKAIAGYLVRHMLLVFDRLGGSEDFQRAKRILSAIEADPREYWSRSDLFARVRNRTSLVATKDMDAALEILADYGWICHKRVEGSPKPYGYDVNPSVWYVEEDAA